MIYLIVEVITIFDILENKADVYANIDEKTTYWLAGILEGEGSFMTGTPSNPNMSRVRVAMTDEDIIKKVAKIFKKNFSAHKRSSPRKTIYITSVQRAEAISLMKRIYPLMGERRQKQIERAVKAWDPHAQGRSLAKLTGKQAREIYERVQSGKETQKEIAN